MKSLKLFRGRSAGGDAEYTQEEAAAAFPSFVLLGMVTMVAPFAMSAPLPTLGKIVEELGGGAQLGQAVVTVYLIGYAISMLFAGLYTDGVRPKLAMVISLALSNIGFILAAVAPNMTVLLLARLLQSLGAGVLLIIPYAVVQEALEGEVRDRAVSVITALYSVAVAAAPVLGGYISSSCGWRAGFWLCAVGGILLLCRFQRTFPRLYVRQKPVMKHVEVLRRGARLLVSEEFRAFTLLQMAGSAIFYGFFSAGPILLVSRLGVSEVNFGIIMSVFCAFFPLGNYLASPLTKRMKSSKVLAIGATINLSGMLLMLALSHVANVYSILLPMIMFAIGYGICSPLAVSRGTSVDTHISGYASALMFSITMLFGAVAASIIGLLSLDCPLQFGVYCVASSVIMMLAVYIGTSSPLRARRKRLRALALGKAR